MRELALALYTSHLIMQLRGSGALLRLGLILTRLERDCILLNKKERKKKKELAETYGKEEGSWAWLWWYLGHLTGREGNEEHPSKEQRSEASARYRWLAFLFDPAFVALLESVEKTDPRRVKNLLREWELALYARDWHAESKRWENYDIHTLWLDEIDYPEALLFRLKSPPPLLFYRGKAVPEILASPLRLTVVGTRQPTSYGRMVTRQIAEQAASVDIPVISGFAKGIDHMAHLGALQAGGKTLAILANGPDYIYPAMHREWLPQLLSQGGLLSEFPPGVRPKRSYFPSRNRLLSALGDCVVIPEAGLASGSLITANFANEQNVDVYAVPGCIYSPQSHGTNQLLTEGAHMILNARDLINSIIKDYNKYLKPGEDLKEEAVQREASLLESGKASNLKYYPSRSEKSPKRELTNEEELIMRELLAGEKMSEDLLEVSGLEPGELLWILSSCEREGLIFQQDGRYSVTDMGMSCFPDFSPTPKEPQAREREEEYKNLK